MFSEEKNFITSTIRKRKDKYFIISEKELKLVDNTNSILDIISETLIILGSGLLGFLMQIISNLDSLKHISLNQIIFLFVASFLFILGFMTKYKKTKNINEIIKIYHNDNL